mmetsp:Transcript_20688/g.40631  ORF Transcript_20688/g.40631 Transcript_20688/m.40631 type:complete len:259 (-) Transcript_20688:2082-2858(-)
MHIRKILEKGRLREITHYGGQGFLSRLSNLSINANHRYSCSNATRDGRATRVLLEKSASCIRRRPINKRRCMRLYSSSNRLGDLNTFRDGNVDIFIRGRLSSPRGISNLTALHKLNKRSETTEYSRILGTPRSQINSTAQSTKGLKVLATAHFHIKDAKLRIKTGRGKLAKNFTKLVRFLERTIRIFCEKLSPLGVLISRNTRTLGLVLAFILSFFLLTRLFLLLTLRLLFTSLGLSLLLFSSRHARETIFRGFLSTT